MNCACLFLYIVRVFCYRSIGNRVTPQTPMYLLGLQFRSVVDFGAPLCDVFDQDRFTRSLTMSRSVPSGERPVMLTETSDDLAALIIT